MSQEPIPLATASARKTLRGSTRLILAFLAASLAAHAAFIVALPGFFHAASPARMSVLEVTVLKPEPLPAATVPLEAIPRQQRAGQKSRKSQAPLTAAREPSAPVLSLSRPEPAAESSFAIAPAAHPEQQPAPVPKSQVTGVVSPAPSINAAYLSNPAPRYPLSSRRSGEQGTVTLRVLVRRDGTPSRVVVERSSGSPQLDTAAQEAVRGWRFAPARQGADPVESWVLVPVVFRLEGSSWQRDH